MRLLLRASHCFAALYLVSISARGGGGGPNTCEGCVYPVGAPLVTVVWSDEPAEQLLAASCVQTTVICAGLITTEGACQVSLTGPTQVGDEDGFCHDCNGDLFGSTYAAFAETRPPAPNEVIIRLRAGVICHDFWEFVHHGWLVMPAASVVYIVQPATDGAALATANIAIPQPGPDGRVGVRYSGARVGATVVRLITAPDGEQGSV